MCHCRIELSTENSDRPESSDQSTNKISNSKENAPLIAARVRRRLALALALESFRKIRFTLDVYSVSRQCLFEPLAPNAVAQSHLDKGKKAFRISRQLADKVSKSWLRAFFKHGRCRGRSLGKDSDEPRGSPKSTSAAWLRSNSPDPS